MITNKDYYIDELFLPMAKPDITDNVVTTPAKLQNFIDKYEAQFLRKLLGPPLAKLFIAELDSSQENGLKGSADEKWNRLLNGHEYTDQKGEDVEWLGIRRKFTEDGEYLQSMCANYVYVMFEQNSNESRQAVISGQAKSKNFSIVNKAPKISRSWNEMVRQIVGREVYRKEYYTLMGYGVDYYERYVELDLYTFIEDMNRETENYYPNFIKWKWELINKFGL